MEKKIYDSYVSILKEELKAAMGCTEPIAVAYAAAKARAVLGKRPDKIHMYCSGNIIKNVKGVTVPNSDGMKGIEAAAVLGVIGGREELELEVLSRISQEEIKEVKAAVEAGICSCGLAEDEENLYIRAEVSAGAHQALVEIRDKHTNIIRIEKDGQMIYRREEQEISLGEEPAGDKDLLNLHDIVNFADELCIEDVREVLERQIAYNTAISQEGLKNTWGVNVGKTMLEVYGEERTDIRAAAAAAAGSDARMSGCAMPVVINSGSGNQGMAVSLPVIEYAKELNSTQEELLCALALANLISVHQKRFIGSLSAYCGAVSAGCAAACGIAYLEGAKEELIGNVIINTISTIGGMVCDGAKASCANKIASAVETALLSYRLAKRGRVFQPGEGLVDKNVEQTIRNMGRMGRYGMKSTDVEILKIMIGQ